MKMKKLLISAMAAILAAVSFVPSTFSWYTHNASAQGNTLRYSDELPVSAKSEQNSVSSVTYVADANGVVADDASPQTAISVTPAEKVKYYKTTLRNTGSNDVYVSLDTSNLPNNADFVIGTLSPTINEKAYASRATRSKVSRTSVRVYFKTNSSFSDFWAKDDGTLDTEHSVGNSNTTSNDINIAYSVNGTESYAKMTKCSGTDTSSDSSNSNKVYWYDVPSNAESFYFFNHWYLRSASNREWNRTIDIFDFSAGRLYYLTGSKVDEKWKEYAVKTVDTNLAAVNQYYNTVRMSMGTGVFADIGLKKTSDAEDFVPEYYGESITYSSANTAVATVNKDGLITPVGQGNTTITTTITGRYKDTIVLTTAVDIPANITQVPIIQNVKVPARANGEDGRVVIDWYALNKSAQNTMTTDAIFFTL